MNQIGIFTRTFSRPDLERTLDAVVEHGIHVMQFTMSCAGLPSMPETIEPQQAMHIRNALHERGIRMAAVSGTFNMIHPDRQQRREGLQCLRTLAQSCAAIGTTTITLCTGTRDPENMWRRHPDNSSKAAWNDLVETMHEATSIAEEHGVVLAFEPEVSNVVDSAKKARQLLDEVRSPQLKVVLDPANLFHTGELPRMHAILEEAFELLGPDIVMAHAKDLTTDGEAGHDAAGTGVLDYEHYMALLAILGRDVPLILHGLSEAQVSTSVSFLRARGANL